MLPAPWTRTGAIAGLIYAAGYLMFALAPLPLSVRRLIFFLMPLGGILLVAGLYAALRQRRNSVTLQAAALFGLIGFSIMEVLAVVQIAIHVRMNSRVPAIADGAARELIQWTQDGVNALHLGLDVAFDIVMMRDPRFGRMLGTAGCVAAAAALVLNLITIPIRPDPDLGPIVGAWLLAVAVWMLWNRPVPASSED